MTRREARKTDEDHHTTRLYTVAEVQDVLAIGRTKAYELIATRQLPAVRIGRSLRVTEEDLRAFVERNRQ